MNSSLAHLTPVQRRELDTAKRIIVQAVRPEKIILFGIFSVEAEARLFSERLPPGIGAYDLLVVTSQGDRRSDYELQDIIENRCREEVSVTALVHDIGYVNRRIAEGQCFFTHIRRESILLYDAGRTPLAKAVDCDPAQVRLMAERDFDRWRHQSVAFFRSAEFNLVSGEWKLVLFMLHQAAEQIYQAILLAFTGYKPTTHNLDKLRRYTNRFSVELALLFPRNSEEEDRLFKVLLSGYVDARYKDDCVVTEEDARLLTERVKQLLEIADRICGNRLLSLGKQAAQS
ncbi:MAG TPA: HEPN domain-containing protein [Puia sp.]|jgi:HEPN domain-containing protein|nr:HEPN domain-containing protein [Puia sp.]